MNTMFSSRAVRRVAAALIVGAFPAISSSAAGQQGVDSDPCLQILSEVGSLELLAKMALSDAASMNNSLYEMDAWKKGVLLNISGRSDDVAAGKALSDAERQQWRKIRDCVDWLRDVARRIDEAMGDQGIVELTPPGGRGQPPRGRVNRATFVQGLVVDLAKMQTDIAAMLERRKK